MICFRCQKNKVAESTEDNKIIRRCKACGFKQVIPLREHKQAVR